MPANVLSLKMDRTRRINNPYLEVLDGHRAIMAVQRIMGKVQTTVLFGRDLYVIGLTSNLDEATIWGNFLNSFSGRSCEWAQLNRVPPPPLPTPGYLLQYQTGPPMGPPVSTGRLTLLSAGWDPLRGFWIEFAGNYWLTFPIFKDWASHVVRDQAGYKGFQPSANNPGPGPGGGQGSGGAPPGGCTTI